MASFWQRVGGVVSNSIRGTQTRHDDDNNRPAPPRGRHRPDVKSAWRILECEDGADLKEVRSAYRRLAQHYHPKTQDPVGAPAAVTIIATFTGALEVLEAHLLPLADDTSEETGGADGAPARPASTPT